MRSDAKIWGRSPPGFWKQWKWQIKVERGVLSRIVTNFQLTIAQFSDRSRSAGSACVSWLLLVLLLLLLVWKQSDSACLRQSIRQSQTMTLIKTVTHSVDNYHSSSRRDSHCRRCLRRIVRSPSDGCSVEKRLSRCVRARSMFRAKSCSRGICYRRSRFTCCDIFHWRLTRLCTPWYDSKFLPSLLSTSATLFCKSCYVFYVRPVFSQHFSVFLWSPCPTTCFWGSFPHNPHTGKMSVNPPLHHSHCW